MKTLCIIAYSDYGTDSRIINQAESALRAGYSVDVITPRKKGESATGVHKGIRIRKLHVQEYSGTSSILYVISYIRFFVGGLFRVTLMDFARKYAVIQVCNIPDFLVFMTSIARLSGTKTILDIHDPMPGTYAAKFGGGRTSCAYRLLLFQEKLSAAFADRVITVHEPVKKDILMKDGISPQKITVVANFANDEVFRFVDDYILQRPLRMIYHGTIASRFGFGRVLETLADEELRENFTLKIIGEGEYSDQLRSHIKTLCLERSVDFENRRYPVDQLPGIIGRYHLGLVPYERSPATDYMLPVKMMELLVMGIPCITVSNVAIRYYLQEDMYFPYDPANLSTLKDTLKAIQANPGLIMEKREALRKNHARFKWGTESRKYLDLLKDLQR